MLWQSPEFRTSTGIGDSPILLALPGSRSGEVRRLLPVFGEVVRQVLARFPAIRIVIPAAESVAQTVVDVTKGWSSTPVILDPRASSTDITLTRKRTAFSAANYAVAASGTVSLELASASTPMVVAYDMNWLSWQIMSRVSKVDTVTLVNLLVGRKAIPEFLGPACSPYAISGSLNELIGLFRGPEPATRGHGGIAAGSRARWRGSWIPRCQGGYGWLGFKLTAQQ